MLALACASLSALDGRPRFLAVPGAGGLACVTTGPVTGVLKPLDGGLGWMVLADVICWSVGGIIAILF